MPDITIDKSSLVYDDNEFEYKTRVPGTFGEDIRYLWIKKDDVDEINEGKTILTSLDDESKYMLYDKDDNLKIKPNKLSIFNRIKQIAINYYCSD